jgi:hypothetical protein
MHLRHLRWYHKLPIKHFFFFFLRGRAPPGKWRGALLKMPSRSTKYPKAMLEKELSVKKFS